MRKFYLAVIILSIYFCQGCASTPSCCLISVPKINLTGQRTVIERQIVGDYKEIEEDAWATSSLQTTVQQSKSKKTAAGGDRELFAAMKIREYHKDRIREYKNEGVIGESFTGYIEYRSVKKYDKDKVLKRRLNSLIKEENYARTTIFKRQYYSANKKEANKLQYKMWGGTYFSKEQEKKSAKGDWLKRKSGRWVQK